MSYLYKTGDKVYVQGSFGDLDIGMVINRKVEFASILSSVTHNEYLVKYINFVNDFALWHREDELSFYI